MAEINIIPDRILPALTALANLEESELSELMGVLDAASPAMWTNQLSSEIASKIKSIEPSKAQSIVNSLVSLYIVRNEFGLSVEDAVKQILSANKESEGAAFNEEQKRLLEPILPRVLSFNKSLGVTAKAIDVFMQHEHVFCNARMMTDIRPIFQEDLSERPNAAAVVHTLKIGYHLGKEYKEFFVALDNEDVETLRELLNRDSVKTKSVHQILTDAKITLLEA